MSQDDLSAEEQEALQSASEELDAQGEIEAQAEHGVSPSPPLLEGDGGTEAAETTSAWQRTLEGAGFQTFDDVDNAVEALVESNRQRDNQIKQYADQLQFYQDQLRSRDAHQPASQPAADPPAPKDPLSQLAEEWTDPSWASQYIEIDDEGNRVISDGVDDDTRDRILGIDRKLRQWQEVLQDPRAFSAAIDQRVEAMIQDRFESSYQQKQTQAQEDAAIDTFVDNNADWLYLKDPATGQYVQDIKGQFVYSDRGEQFLGYMKGAAKDGVSSVSAQLRYAQMALGISPSSQTASVNAPPPSSGAIAADQRNAMRGRTNTARSRQTSFNGVSAESGGDPTGRRQMTFGEETLAAMKLGE